MKTRNQHAEGQGLSCPRCASDDLNALDGMNFNAGSIEQEMQCETCKAVWWDIYTLTGYEPHIGIEGESLVIPDDAPEPTLAEAVAALREAVAETRALGDTPNWLSDAEALLST